MIDLLFIVLPDTLLLDLAGPAEAFRLANQWLQRRKRRPAFRLRFAGPRAETSTSVGATLAGLEPLPSSLDAPTWVVVMGLPGSDAEALARLDRPSRDWLAVRDWLGHVVAPRLGERLPGIVESGDSADHGHHGDEARAGLLTICSGALLAADAGLLAGRRCTTHHDLLQAVSGRAAGAQVSANRVFVVDGPVASSAGITAGIDLALHLVAQVCGEGVAAAIARDMVVYLRRGPDDPQLSPMLAFRNHLHPAVHRVQDAVCERPGADWTAEAMAEVAHVTPRHLGRLFKAQTGLSPRDYVERVRYGLTQSALAHGDTVTAASERAGFTSARQWRRARARQATPAG
jgi:transcriptional regulator GlxA family with amidase domain